MRAAGSLPVVSLRTLGTASYHGQRMGTQTAADSRPLHAWRFVSVFVYASARCSLAFLAPSHKAQRPAKRLSDAALTPCQLFPPIDELSCGCCGYAWKHSGEVIQWKGGKSESSQACGDWDGRGSRKDLRRHREPHLVQLIVFSRGSCKVNQEESLATSTQPHVPPVCWALGRRAAVAHVAMWLQKKEKSCKICLCCERWNCNNIRSICGREHV